MNNPICNSVFDSRDLIEYFDEVKEELLNYWKEYLEDHNINVDEDEEIDADNQSFEDIDFQLEGFSEKHYKEIEDYEELDSFITELEQCSDFEYGISIIHEDYWVEYIEDLCKDIGEIPDNLPWYISNHIDWDGVANEISVDYITLSYNNETYYAR